MHRIPDGWRAVRGWFAQPSVVRKQVKIAARHGSPAGDVEFSAIAAGYARLSRRWTGAVVLVARVALLVLLAGWLVDGSQSAPDSVALGALAWFFLETYLIKVTAARTQIYMVNRWFVEQAALRELEEAPAATVVAAGQRGGQAGPAGGEVDIVVARGRLIARLALALTWIAIDLGTLVVITNVTTGRIWLWAFLLLGIPLTVRLWQFGSLLGGYGPYLVEPVVVRLGPDGWECPGPGLRGSWDEVTGLTVIPANAALGEAADDQRWVVFELTESDRDLAGVSGVWRRVVARSLQRSGSPVSVGAVPGLTVDVVTAVASINRFTATPAHWG